jgi:plastocyanin
LTRRTAALVAVACLALLPACDDERRAISRDDLPEVPSEPTHVVEMTDDGFEPDELTVTTDDLVEFRNVGDDEHGVRTEGAVIDTGLLLPGESTEIVFDQPDRYEITDVGDDRHTMTVVSEEPVPRD